MQEEDTISNKSIQLDSIEWSSEHEGILIDWADKSLCFRWLHAKAYEYNVYDSCYYYEHFNWNCEFCSKPVSG